MPIDQEKVVAARAADKAAKVAQQAYYDALDEAYPVGTRTYYGRGNGWVACEVIAHSTHGDLIVRGDSSGKEYRVNGWRFHE